MIEAVEKAPKKMFGKKKPQLAVVSTESLQGISSNEPIDFFTQSLKQEILIQDSKIETVLKSTSGNISDFRGPGPLDWNKSTGRVQLAEKIMQQSEAQFLQFRRQMEMRADADGCGGVNEGAKLSTGDLFSSNITSINGNKSFAEKQHNPTEGNHQHCEHGQDYGECSQGCKAAA